ncbi:MAG: phosphate acyltransferase, partial [Bacteroidota bacterium]
MNISSLDSFIGLAKSKKIRKIAVAAAADEYVLASIKNACKEKLVIPILIVDQQKIEKLCKSIKFELSKIEIINEPDLYCSAAKSVELIRKGNADLLMKGLISTDILLKAVLDKENGLRKGGVISHIAFFESPYYHKIFAVTDAAMNIAPDLDEKVSIVKNVVEAFHRLGIKNPKVAVLCAVENVNSKMEATMHAAMLTQMNKRGQIKNCIIDGPLAFDIAVSKEAAKHKGIISDVSGDADIFI